MKYNLGINSKSDASAILKIQYKIMNFLFIYHLASASSYRPRLKKIEQQESLYNKKHVITKITVLVKKKIRVFKFLKISLRHNATSIT